MFGRDRPAPLGDEVVHLPADLLPFVEHPTRMGVGRGDHVEMDVAVAQVPEGDRLGPGPVGLDLRHGRLDEIGHALDRHRDVVLNSLAASAFGGRDRLAQQPEGLGLGFVRSDGRVADQISLEGVGHDRLAALAQPLGRGGVGDDLDQCMPGVRPAQRRARVGQVVEHGLQAGARHHLEALERIAGAVRQGDIVARLAGDEFAVIARNVRTEPGAIAMAERIFESLRAPWLYDGRLNECRVSIGASLAPRHGDCAEELFKHADIALYEAKARGKGQIAVYRPSMKSAVEKRNRQISLARHALSRDLIVPYYQPKVELASGRVAGFEALLRWRHPTQGVQMPGTIGAAFEDLELAHEITERMLGQVLLDMRRWLDRGLPFGHVAINVTAADLRQDNFADRLLESLAGLSLPHDCLQVEVTETVFLGRGAEYVERALRQLHDAGIRVALDDFGTGYASLSHLKQFPVDIVKIDRSFLNDFARDPQNQAIINTVINLGHSLDIEIVAEGIETGDQERHLLARGCTYGQGWLYGKAMPALRVPRLLTTFQREFRRAA